MKNYPDILEIKCNCHFSAARADIESNIDDVCKLLRGTGFAAGRRPPKYPEDYFRSVFWFLNVGCLPNVF